MGGAGLAACGSPPPVSTAPLHPNRTVTYCTDGGQALAMDLYTVAHPPKGGSPVVVFIHGGGWVFGNRRDDPYLTALVPRLTQAKVAVASIDYRLAGTATFPAQIVDVECALRYLRANGSQFGIDPSRLALMGSSAGAQLAALAGLAEPPADWDNGQWGGPPAPPTAVVDLFGPADLDGGHWIRAMVKAITVTFGAAPGSHDERLLEASPVSWVRAGEPPVLIVQGTADRIVPPAQSEELARRLRQAGDPVRLVLVSGGQHGLTTAHEQPDQAALVQTIANFLEGKLGA